MTVTSTLAAFAQEAFGAIWMELAMFAVSALAYVLFVGGVPRFGLHGKKQAKEVPVEDHHTRTPHTGALDLQRQGSIIKTFTKDRNLTSAIALFNRLRDSGAQLNCFVCNCFLDSCAECGDIDRAEAQFTFMQQMSLVDVVSYNTLLKAFLAKGRFEEAHLLVQQMQASGIQANKVTYNELLNSKVVCKDQRGVWKIFDEMRQAGVKCNSVTCSILMKSLTPSSTAAELRKITDLIDDNEDAMDEVLMSAVIEACIRTRQLDLLTDLLDRFRRKGGVMNLTSPLYGTMIKAFGSAGQMSKVQELWTEMQACGVKPSSITIGCMVEAYAISGCAEEAWEFVRGQLQMEDHRGCINTVIYSTLMKGFAANKRVDKAFMVYEEMRAHGIPCNSITYNTLLDACAKCSAMSRAPKLLQDMKDSSVNGDVITYSTIIKGFCLEGDMDRAFQMLSNMQNEQQLIPDEITYNSILDGCAKSQRLDDAMRVLDQMMQASVPPSNYTLSILVKLLGHQRRLNQAFQMVEDLCSKFNFRPNVQVYTCLASACFMNRRPEKAMQLHDKLVESGCEADAWFYAVLARGCLQGGNGPFGLQKSLEVVRAAYRLQGHSLAVPSRVVGVDAKALGEVFAKLQNAGPAEREAAETLKAEVRKISSLTVGSKAASGQRGGRGNICR